MAAKEYSEIFKLKSKLEEANIPFVFTDDLFDVKEKLKKGGAQVRRLYNEQYPAYQIRLNNFIDAVQHIFSHGEASDLLEICGGLTVEENNLDSVLGWMTAEEVFKRFKYCWEHQTSVYEMPKEDRLANEKELKPCPFCGSNSLKIESKHSAKGDNEKTYTATVRCNKCHARGGTASYTARIETLKRAVDLWNRRF